MYVGPVWKSKAELCKELCIKCEDEERLQPLNRVTFGSIYDDLILSLFARKKDQCDLLCAHDV